MKIIRKNLRKGEIKVKIMGKEDFWYLSQIISGEDLVKGQTERKIKLGSDSDRQKKVVKKKVFLQIKVEKIENNDEFLRISGTIEQGPEDIAKGSHHSFKIEPNSEITITKESWMNYELEKLKEATEESKDKVLIVLFDREEALFVFMKNQGFEVISKIKGEVAKKDRPESEHKDFYKEIVENLESQDKRFEPSKIIIASPGFWKEYLVKELPSELKKKTIIGTCSSVSESSIKELTENKETSSLLEKERSGKETALFQDLLKAISKEKACYGLKDCEEKILMGAVEKLFVSYSFLEKKRKENKHRFIEKLMKTSEQMNGEVIILSTEEVDDRLNNLGGIAGILRWK
jgi:mRNA surveillance protein pelota